MASAPGPWTIPVSVVLQLYLQCKNQAVLDITLVSAVTLGKPVYPYAKFESFCRWPGVVASCYL